MYKNYNHNWKEGRKLNNLRESIFTYGCLMMDVGRQEYGSLRYKRVNHLASKIIVKIVSKWGDK